MNDTTLAADRLPLSLRPLLRDLERLDRGTLTLELNGRELILSGARPGLTARMRLQRPLRLLVRLLRHGDIGFAEGFIAGDWWSPDPVRLLQLLGDNEHRLTALGTPGLLARAAERLRHWRNRNSRRGSRRNITYHYDLGNDFYRLWLDRGMTYSAALFEGDGDSLERAQARKYDRLLDRLDARPGERLLEIGCGWGGLAEAAARRGVRVDAITLSREQLAWTRRRIAAAGIGERVDARLCDYRDLDGEYDHIVSIEMFEAVGEAYWPGFMQTLKRCLKPGGRAALQVITIDDRYFERYRTHPEFIQRYIFPGGMLPSEQRLLAQARAAGLRAVDLARFGGDYARTLGEWHRRFREAEEWIEALGFDAAFRRMWRYYLSYCEAGFRLGRIDVVHLVLGLGRG